MFCVPFLYSTDFYFFDGLERVGYSFAYAAHGLVLRDVCIRTQRAAVAQAYLACVMSSCGVSWSSPSPQLDQSVVRKTPSLSSFF
jgi:hypothetical protein